MDYGENLRGVLRGRARVVFETRETGEGETRNRSDEVVGDEVLAVHRVSGLDVSGGIAIGPGGPGVV